MSLYRVFVIVCSLCLIAATVGCSGKLSRREAKRQIDEMLKPHPVGPKKVMWPGTVPGFELEEGDIEQGATFHVGDHMTYGPLAFEKSQTTDAEDYLVNALGKLGYLNVHEDGPASKMVFGRKLDYSHSRSVSLTSKLGKEDNRGYAKDYSSGFSCYPPPDFHQCDTPNLTVEAGANYTITGITQDESHAKVNILIPWKLPQFASELKPYAHDVLVEENKNEDSGYYRYPALFSWVHFLNEHAVAGQSPATILFQKFDDGWRIVDSTGKSSKDFETQK